MQHTVLVLGVLVALASTAYIEKYQRTEDGREYFIEFGRTHNWFQALHACARKNMSLVTMDSMDKSEQFKKLFKKLSVNEDPWLWLAGSSNAGDKRRYHWLNTGQSFAASNWAKGEPSNADDENCVAIWNKDAEWNNLPCSFGIGYICEEISLANRNDQELMALKTSYELQIKKLKSNVEKETKKSCEEEKALMKKEQIEQVNEMKKVHDTELQELKEKCNKSSKAEDKETYTDTAKQIDQLTKAKNELDLKLTDCLKAQKTNGSNITNKYYNLILNVTANAQQLKLMGSP